MRDYNPFTSSISNLAILAAKIFNKFLDICHSSETIRSNHFISLVIVNIQSNSFVSYAKDKPLWRCGVLLVPLLGNFIVVAYHTYREKKFYQQQDECIKQAINDLSQKKLQLIDDTLNHDLINLPKNITYFQKLIDNNECSFLFFNMCSFHALHLAKINPKDMTPEIQQKLQQISEKRKQLLKMRVESYRNRLQMMTNELLLKEAKKYYLSSHYHLDQEILPADSAQTKDIKIKVQNMDLKEIVSHMERALDNPDIKAFELVEMRIITELVQSRKHPA